MGRVGFGRVGLQNSPPWVGRIGSDLMSKISVKYTIYTQETDYSMTLIHNDKKLQHCYLLPFNYLFQRQGRVVRVKANGS